MNYSQMRSPIAKAKNFGSSHKGTHHWRHQRLTSIMMLPLVIWLVYFIHEISGQEISAILSCLQKPYNIVPVMLLLLTGFYHGSLGMRVIIEDYIGNLCARYCLIIAVQVFSIVTVISAIIALLYLVTF